MYFEDLTVGQTFSAQEVAVDKQAILEFAAEFDPQPIHVDEEFAVSGPFMGLIASGMHTLSMVWGAVIRSGLLANHSEGGLGMDHVRVHDAVRAGDVLRVQVTVRDLRVTRRGRGLCRMDFDVTKKNEGNRALTFQTHFLIERRPAGATPLATT